MKDEHGSPAKPQLGISRFGAGSPAHDLKCLPLTEGSFQLARMAPPQSSPSKRASIVPAGSASNCSTDVGLSESTSKAKSKKKQEPCRICGVIFEEMPRNGKECYEHQKDVAALQKWLEVQVASDQKNTTKKG